MASVATGGSYIRESNQWKSLIGAGNITSGTVVTPDSPPTTGSGFGISFGTSFGE